MTIFFVLIAILLLAETVAGVRLFRHDRPLTPPPSHHDWAAGPLPSTPYAVRR